MQAATTVEDQRVAALHGELRRLVRGISRGGALGDRVLEPLAVLQEAYLRLGPSRRPSTGLARHEWQSRAEFRGMAAHLLRDTIRNTVTRNGVLAYSIRLAFGVTAMGGQEAHYDFGAVDRLIDVLAETDRGLAGTLELVCFGALSDRELAFAQQIPLGKVRRDLECAWSWFIRKMAEDVPKSVASE